MVVRPGLAAVNSGAKRPSASSSRGSAARSASAGHHGQHCRRRPTSRPGTPPPSMSPSADRASASRTPTSAVGTATPRARPPGTRARPRSYACAGPDRRRNRAPASIRPSPSRPTKTSFPWSYGPLADTPEQGIGEPSSFTKARLPRSKRAAQ